jgi:hypothetical protein
MKDKEFSMFQINQSFKRKSQLAKLGSKIYQESKKLGITIMMYFRVL